MVDGRSGAGKTSMAHALAAALADARPRVVSLDEFYPGWSGLAAASAIAADLVVAHAAGETGVYRPWDWVRDEWAPEERAVDPSCPLIIEGCGALTPRAAASATCAVWLDGDPVVRRERALARDGETFRPHWAAWARQEDVHIDAHDPAVLATIAARVC